MNFIPMSELLADARAGGYAVPSFCVWNAESMRMVLEVATDLKAPVILMAGPGDFGLLSPFDWAAVARCMAGRFSVRAALHLDHGNAVSQVEDCLKAGFTSVMVDFSSRPYHENVQALHRTVELAHPCGVTVEGEIGHVGQADTVTLEGAGDSTLTKPEDAVRFVADTGVDALAISIGNAHGKYTSLPRFDFERLSAIHAAVSVPLVLHGGSGTPDADLKRAISLGIAKVNVATDLITAVRESLLSQWNAGEKMWLPQAAAVAIETMREPLTRWIQRTGAAGRA